LETIKGGRGDIDRCRGELQLLKKSRSTTLYVEKAKVFASVTVKLKQNGTQTVAVGAYTVTVVVNGNNKITDIYIGTPKPAAKGNQNQQ